MTLLVTSIGFAPYVSSASELDSRVEKSEVGDTLIQRLDLSSGRSLPYYWSEYDINEVSVEFDRKNLGQFRVIYGVEGIITSSDYILDSYGLVFLDLDGGSYDYMISVDDDASLGNISPVFSRMSPLPISTQTFADGCNVRTRPIGYSKLAFDVDVEKCDLELQRTVGVSVSLGFGYGSGARESTGNVVFESPQAYVGYGTEQVDLVTDFPQQILSGQTDLSFKIKARSKRTGLPSINKQFQIQSDSQRIRFENSSGVSNENGNLEFTASVSSLAEGRFSIALSSGDQRWRETVNVARVVPELWGDQTFENRISCLSADIEPQLANDLNITHLQWSVTRSFDGVQIADTYDWPIGHPAEGEAPRVQDDEFGVRYTTKVDGEIYHGIWLNNQKQGEKVQCFLSPKNQHGTGSPTLHYETAEISVEDGGKPFETFRDLNSDAKLNAGSFKGYVALYAKGYQGHKLSAKVGKDWVIVESIESDFERYVEFTGAGYDINVRMFIDGEFVFSKKLTTK